MFLSSLVTDGVEYYSESAESVVNGMSDRSEDFLARFHEAPIAPVGIILPGIVTLVSRNIRIHLSNSVVLREYSFRVKVQILW